MSQKSMGKRKSELFQSITCQGCVCGCVNEGRIGRGVFADCVGISGKEQVSEDGSFVDRQRRHSRSEDFGTHWSSGLQFREFLGLIYTIP